MKSSLTCWSGFFFSSGGGLDFFVPNVFPIASHFIIPD